MALASYSQYAYLLAVILSVLLFSPSIVAATSLTYKIEANEKACFYAWVDKVGEKIAFYFAVPLSLILNTSKCRFFRFKRVEHLILIMLLRILKIKSSLMEKKKDRETLYLRHNNQESILSAFQMICLLLLKKW